MLGRIAEKRKRFTPNCLRLLILQKTFLFENQEDKNPRECGGKLELLIGWTRPHDSCGGLPFLLYSIGN
jgi:hypothetical protein